MENGRTMDIEELADEGGRALVERLAVVAWRQWQTTARWSAIQITETLASMSVKLKPEVELVARHLAADE